MNSSTNGLVVIASVKPSRPSEIDFQYCSKTPTQEYTDVETESPLSSIVKNPSRMPKMGKVLELTRNP
jgi:hypothetical protein